MLSTRSLKNLQGVHPDLVAVAHRAAELTPIPFEVIEGLRTLERQKQLVAAGASKTMKSRHLTGHAIDIVPTVEGQIRWDWPLFRVLAPAMKQAAQEKGVALEWGGDWRTFKDGPHFQLTWERYPA
jgi:peptidoglycan L-alanyl-D-glutamate endopeptidase CwlK